jgi:hypothetical protein
VKHPIVEKRKEGRKNGGGKEEKDREFTKR